MFGLRAKARAYREMERVATNMLNYAEETLEYDSVKTRDIIETVDNLFTEFGYPKPNFLLKYENLLQRKHEILIAAIRKGELEELI